MIKKDQFQISWSKAIISVSHKKPIIKINIVKLLIPSCKSYKKVWNFGSDIGFWSTTQHFVLLYLLLLRESDQNIPILGGKGKKRSFPPLSELKLAFGRGCLGGIGARAQNILPSMPKNHDFLVFTAMWDSARAKIFFGIVKFMIKSRCKFFCLVITQKANF